MLLTASMMTLLSGSILNLAHTLPTYSTIIIYIVSMLIIIPAYVLSRSSRRVEAISLYVLTASWIISTIINIYYQQVAITSYLSLPILAILLIHIQAGIWAVMINIITIIALFLFQDSFPIVTQTIDRDVFFVVITVGNLLIIYSAIYFIALEISARKSSNQKLIQQIKDDLTYQHDRVVKEYDNVLNALSEAVIITDMGLNITAWNKAAERIYGHQKADIIGKKITDVIPTIFNSDDHETTTHQRQLQEGIWQNHVIQTRKDQTMIYILSSLSLLYSPDNKPIGAITINQEITECVKLEQKIGYLNKVTLTLDQLRQDMMTLVSVDIRQQINTLRSQSQSLQHKLRDDPIVAKTNGAIASIEQLTNTIIMINDVYRQVDSGKEATIDIRRMIEEAVKSHTPIATQKGVKLSLSVEDHMLPMTVKGDEKLIMKAITTYINNAINFTSTGDEIKVELFINNQQVHYVVSDTGKGFPQNRGQDIFQPYLNHRNNFTQDTLMGLSLYMVKSIILRYNGTMIFESEYGKGSVFGFTLPHFIAPVL